MAKKHQAKQVKQRPASYFIDYENVRGAGLNGVEALGKHDRVFVLYGSKDSALKLEQVQNVLASPAKVEFIKVATGKHDALDFQLVALMFLNMKKKRDYFIISKDTGFDFAIRMAKARGMNHVYRRETISGATLEPKKLPQPKGRPVKRLPQPAKPNAQQGRQNAPAKQQGAANAEAPAAQAPQQANDDVATTPAAEAQPQQRTSKSSRRRRRKSSAQQPKPQKDQYRLDIERVLAKHMGGLPTAKKVVEAAPRARRAEGGK